MVINVCELLIKYPMNFLLEIYKNNNQKEIKIEKTKQINYIEKTKYIDKKIEYIKTCHLLFNNNKEYLQKCLNKIFN